MAYLFHGTMFARKTKTLIDYYNECYHAGESVIALKPAIDNRYSTDEIVSHDGERIPATVISKDQERNLLDIVMNYSNIFIDEIQFFSQDIIKPIFQMEKAFNATVMCFGLDFDFKKNWFETTKELYMNPSIRKFHMRSRCAGEDCVNEATYSKKLDDSEEVFDVGGKDKYLPCCQFCWGLL